MLPTKMSVVVLSQLGAANTRRSFVGSGGGGGGELGAGSGAVEGVVEGAGVGVLVSEAVGAGGGRYPRPVWLVFLEAHRGRPEETKVAVPCVGKAEQTGVGPTGGSVGTSLPHPRAVARARTNVALRMMV